MMVKRRRRISQVRIKRLEVQGITGYTADELHSYRWGVRMAYYTCDAIAIAGLITGSIPLLALVMGIAFFGIILPYHPVDYVYNYAVRHLFGNPKIPPRSNQLKFACTLATTLFAATIYFFYAGLPVWGYVTGGTVVVVATLVSTTDICIPSIIYNALFLKRNHKPV